MDDNIQIIVDAVDITGKPVRVNLSNGRKWVWDGNAGALYCTPSVATDKWLDMVLRNSAEWTAQ